MSFATTPPLSTLLVRPWPNLEFPEISSPLSVRASPKQSTISGQQSQGSKPVLEREKQLLTIEGGEQGGVIVVAVELSCQTLVR